MFALPNGATMEFVWIEPGTFTMGSPSAEPSRGYDEGPQHEVRIGSGFWLGKYEVTQEQWEAAMDTRPWSGQSYVQSNPKHPAVYISWEDAQGLVATLNHAEGRLAYRLPTEAEWEYACRAGTMTYWSFGDSEAQLKSHAWYGANACAVGACFGHAVGTKLPNPWGLFDMHGNVWEWVQDWYAVEPDLTNPWGLYGMHGKEWVQGWWTRDPSAAQVDPQGPVAGHARVLRGGAILDDAPLTRSACRNGHLPGERCFYAGVRLARAE